MKISLCILFTLLGFHLTVNCSEWVNPDKAELKDSQAQKLHPYLEEFALETDTIKKLEILYKMGMAAKKFENNVLALGYLSRVNYSLRTSGELQFKSGKAIRDIYYQLGDYNEALNYHNQLNWEKDDNWESLVPLYFPSMVAFKLRDYKTSVSLLKKSIQTVEENSKPYWVMSFTNSLGVVYKDAGKLDSAYITFTRALNVFETNFSDTSSLDYGYIRGLILGNIAQVLSLQDEHLKAIPLFKIDIRNSAAAPHTNEKLQNEAISRLELANSLISTNQLELALSQLDSVHAIIDSTRWFEQKLRYWELTKVYFISKGMLSEALKACGQELRTRDSIDHSFSTKSVRDMKALYEISAVHTLQNASAENIKELNKQLTRANWTLGLTFILIILLVGIVIVLVWTSRSKGSNISTSYEIPDQSDELRNALEEKDMLLREIHHRVKNNLQIISSLFFLQSKQIKDETALGIIREGQSRLQVMSLIHQKLYQAEELNHINYQDYISELAKQILHMHQKSNVEIDITIEAQQEIDSIELAVPLGMIINELLTNSVKHAFTGRKVGHVHVLLIKQAGHVKLTYSDDGIGMSEPESIINGDSLGMKLIRLLSNQLGGVVEIGKSDGFNLSIDFDYESNI